MNGEDDNSRFVSMHVYMHLAFKELNHCGMCVSMCEYVCMCVCVCVCLCVCLCTMY